MLKKLYRLIVGADTVRLTCYEDMQFMLDCNKLARDVQDRRKSESEINGIPRPKYESALLRAAIEGVRA